MTIEKQGNDFIVKHGDTHLRMFAQNESIYIKDENKDRFFGRINGSVGTLVNYD